MVAILPPTLVSGIIEPLQSQWMLESVTAHLILPELDAFLGDTWVGSTEI